MLLHLAGVSQLEAQFQGVPSVQQDQFRSQWVGTQVDQVVSGTGLPFFGSLGYQAGSLETPDQVERQLEAAQANLTPAPSFAFHPALSLGWQIANQSAQAGTPNFSNGGSSSAFAAPSLMIGIYREHGPWTVLGGYSIGYRYYTDQGYTGAGTGAAQNPLSQTAALQVLLEMSRYTIEAMVSGASGSGYDVTSASYNRETSLSATLRAKYLLSSSASLNADAGYSMTIATESTATPNNYTGTAFTDFSSIYDYNDKTHLSVILGAGSSSQSLQQGTAADGNTPLATAQNNNRTYGQALGRLKYDFTDKLVFTAGLGARYVSSSIADADSQYTGVKPAWTLGIGYTPTAKTSLTLSAGEQGADVSPELSLILGWLPREKTWVTLGIYQTEQFANSLSDEYVVSRSLAGSVTQRLFKGVNLSLTGGYGSQQFINLSNQSIAGQNSNQLPASYYFGNLSLNWKIRKWATLVNTLTCSTYQQEEGNGFTVRPQYLYTISLNLAL